MPHNHVIIAGGGPTGLTTALGLAREGVEVTIVERDAEIGTAPRAIVYYFFTLPEFEKLGVLEDLEAEGIPLEGLSFIDKQGGRKATMGLEAIEGLASHPRNISLGQDGLSRVLVKHLEGLPGVRFLRSTTVVDVAQDDSSVTVTVEGPEGRETLVGDYLVGSDGRASTVREALGIEFRGFTYPDRLIATNIVFDFSQHGFGTGNFVIDTRDGAIVVQITDELWRCTFRDPDPEGSTEPEALRERIEAWMALALPGGAHAEYELRSFAPYRIHQRCAATFRSGRVLLAGDAAHVTNPLGGLGLTTGLCDAFVLGPALAAVVSGREQDDILDIYAAERRKAFLDLSSPHSVMNKELVFELHDPAMRAGVLDGLFAGMADGETPRRNLMDLARICTPSVVGRERTTAPAPVVARSSFWVGGSTVDTPAGPALRGQMYVEALLPEAGNGRSVVLVHGGGGQGTDWLTTPDGRPGWAPLLADAGWSVYVVDRPGHGRSPYDPAVLGPMAPQMPAPALRALFRNPIGGGPFSHPLAHIHNQWPGGDEPGDEVWTQFAAAMGPTMSDGVLAQELARDGLVALLDRIGPAVVVSHSMGGPAGYLAADARPDLVEALVQVEPIGPQFATFPDMGLSLDWGVTAVPVAYEPAVSDPSELALVEVPAPAPFPVVVQADPPRRLANLSQVPIALVSGEGSAFRWVDEPVTGFLRQAGCSVESLRLWEHGVRGNGHGLIVELNNADALGVVTGWLETLR